jgi:hypothetical protein
MELDKYTKAEKSWAWLKISIIAITILALAIDRFNAGNNGLAIGLLILSILLSGVAVYAFRNRK